MTESNDKLYIIIILAMIGFFIYWSQKNANIECDECKKRKLRYEKNKNTEKKHTKYIKKIENDNEIIRENMKSVNSVPKKKTVRFEDPNDDGSDISLESLNSIDRSEHKKTTDDESSATLDI